VKKAKANSAGPIELTVGQVAARSGLAVSAIQFYEHKGLIEGRRTAGNRRRYPLEVLKRMAVIKAAHGAGIPLSVVHDTLRLLPRERPPTALDWTRSLSYWRTELDERIARLRRLRAELVGCADCGCLSLESCPLVVQHEG
jgi:MerR family redox-sensitive transcriptional activator SoxR